MDWLKTMLVYLMLVTGTATLDAGATPVPYELLRTPTPVPTATPVPTPTPIPTPTPTPVPTPTPILLHVNSHGEEVRQMQERLIELGYLTGKADGFFGPKTEKAVIAFQKANGLKADGYAGELTLDKLYNDPDVIAQPTATPRK